MALSLQGLFPGSIFKRQTVLAQRIPKVLLSEGSEDAWLELERGLRSPHRGMQGPLCEEQCWGKREGDRLRAGGQCSLCHHSPVQNTKVSENSKFNLGFIGHYHGIFVKI